MSAIDDDWSVGSSVEDDIDFPVTLAVTASGRVAPGNKAAAGPADTSGGHVGSSSSGTGHAGIELVPAPAGTKATDSLAATQLAIHVAGGSERGSEPLPAAPSLHARVTALATPMDDDPLAETTDAFAAAVVGNAHQDAAGKVTENLKDYTTVKYLHDQHLERMRLQLHDQLLHLRKMGFLDASLRPEDSSSAFEVLEFYGDAVLYERVTLFLVQTRRFMSPHLLSTIRTAIVNNKNLGAAYDLLGMDTLLMLGRLPDRMRDRPKVKGDVVESMIGELAEKLRKPDNAAYAGKISEVLDKLLSFVSYVGERHYFVHGDITSGAESAVTARKVVSMVRDVVQQGETRAARLAELDVERDQIYASNQEASRRAQASVLPSAASALVIAPPPRPPPVSGADSPSPLLPQRDLWAPPALAAAVAAGDGAAAEQATRVIHTKLSEAEERVRAAEALAEQEVANQRPAGAMGGGRRSVWDSVRAPVDYSKPQSRHVVLLDTPDGGFQSVRMSRNVASTMPKQAAERRAGGGGRSQCDATADGDFVRNRRDRFRVLDPRAANAPASTCAGELVTLSEAAAEPVGTGASGSRWTANWRQNVEQGEMYPEDVDRGIHPYIIEHAKHKALPATTPAPQPSSAASVSAGMDDI